SKQGWFNTSLTPTQDITTLLDTILEKVPAPQVVEGPLQLQITSLDYSSFLGRIAIVKATRATIKEAQPVMLGKTGGSMQRSRVKELYVFVDMGKKRVTEVECGDICAVVGIEDFQIGETIADAENPEAVPMIPIDEPTMNMQFSINNSPFFGKE